MRTTRCTDGLLPALTVTFLLTLFLAAADLPAAEPEAFAVGPLVAGWMADTTGQLEAGLWLGPVLLAGAAMASMAQARASV